MLAPTAEPQYFEVRDVARACGVADATVRHWEKSGVIAPPARTPAGRRIFTRGEIEVIRAARAAANRRNELGVADAA